MKNFFFIALFLTLSAVCHPAEVVTHDGVITEIAVFPQSYGSYSESAKGRIAIYVEGLPKGCGSGQARVVISEEHPLFDAVLSIALVSKTSGQRVRLAYFDECTIRQESWDFAYISLRN